MKKDLFADLTIAEIENKLERIEAEIIKCENKREKLNRNTSTKMKNEINNTLATLREKYRNLTVLKDSKIPFYEKLPQASEYTKHYMSVSYIKKLNEVVDEQMSLDK